MTAVAPMRLQLARKHGFDLQAISIAANGLPAVSCVRPGPLGNPFTVTGCREAGYRGDDVAIAAYVVELFRGWADSLNWQDYWMGAESQAARSRLLGRLPDLRSKNLACYCKPGFPCHCDVLLELANRPICEAL